VLDDQRGLKIDSAHLLEDIIWISGVEAVEASTPTSGESSSKASTTSGTGTTLQTLFSNLVIQVSLLLPGQQPSDFAPSQTHRVR